MSIQLRSGKTKHSLYWRSLHIFSFLWQTTKQQLSVSPGIAKALTSYTETKIHCSKLNTDKTDNRHFLKYMCFQAEKKTFFSNDRKKATSLEDNSPVLAFCYPVNLISELVLLAVYLWLVAKWLVLW